ELSDDWRRLSGGSPAWTADGNKGSWRVHVKSDDLRGHTLNFVVAAPLTDAQRERRETEEAMTVGIPLVLLLAAAGGLWLSAFGLRPITLMAARASALAPADPSDLGESGRSDELGQLARAFNGLVARLRLALKTQRQFMADASHELRTPASVIQSAAE